MVVSSLQKLSELDSVTVITQISIKTWTDTVPWSKGVCNPSVWGVEHSLTEKGTQAGMEPRSKGYFAWWQEKHSSEPLVLAYRHQSHGGLWKKWIGWTKERGPVLARYNTKWGRNTWTGGLEPVLTVMLSNGTSCSSTTGRELVFTFTLQEILASSP